MTGERISKLLRDDFSDRLWLVEPRQNLWSCSIGMLYPDDTPVEVFVLPLPHGGFRVTDLGEAGRWAVSSGSSWDRAHNAGNNLSGTGRTKYEAGHVALDVAEENRLAEAIWDVTSFAARLGDAATFTRREKRESASEFKDLVISTLIGRFPAISTSANLTGGSGRRYKPTLFDPDTHRIIEPIASSDRQQLALIYAEFGDLATANGYQGVAVIDDRESPWGEPDVGLLLQVGTVARWENRDQWLSAMKHA